MQVIGCEPQVVAYVTRLKGASYELQLRGVAVIRSENRVDGLFQVWLDWANKPLTRRTILISEHEINSGRIERVAEQLASSLHSQLRSYAARIFYQDTSLLRDILAYCDIHDVSEIEPSDSALFNLAEAGRLATCLEPIAKFFRLTKISEDEFRTQFYAECEIEHYSGGKEG